MYPLLWFDNSPADNAVGVTLRPVDVTAPRNVVLSETPLNNATILDKRPTISVRLEDLGDDGVVFDIDEDSIVLLVNGTR